MVVLNLIVALVASSEAVVTYHLHVKAFQKTVSSIQLAIYSTLP
jgi:hypothetical protein